MEKRAVVVAKAVQRHRAGDVTLANKKVDMSDDLPAEALGELVADVISRAVALGNDPTEFTVELASR